VRPPFLFDCIMCITYIAQQHRCMESTRFTHDDSMSPSGYYVNSPIAGRPSHAEFGGYILARFTSVAHTVLRPLTVC
jgi:hypothetical protein